MAACVALATMVPSAPQASATQATTPAISPRRIALVVGNDRYSGAMVLQNARRDATAIATELTDLGFQTTLLEDATRARLIKALETLSSSLRTGDVAVFFFAGHGAQVRGENYLVPVDYAGTTEEGLTLEGISASQIQTWLERARVSILVLDACRNNPYSGKRSSGTGLAPMEARGSLVAFATGAGQTASDNPTGRQGTFTGALLEALKTPGLSIREVFHRVRQRVYEISRGQQFPAVYDGLLGDLVLRPAPAGAVPTTEVAPRPTPPPSPPPSSPSSAPPSWLVGEFRGVNAATKSVVELSVDASGAISGTADVGGPRPTPVRYEWVGAAQQMRDPTGAYVFEIERTGDGFRVRQLGTPTNVVDYRRIYMPPGAIDARNLRADGWRRVTPDEQAALAGVIQSWARAWDSIDESAGRVFYPTWDVAALKKDRADKGIEKVTSTVACNPATIRRDQARVTCRATMQLEFKVQLTSTSRGATPFGQRPPPRTQGASWTFVLFWNGSAWMIESLA